MDSAKPTPKASNENLIGRKTSIGLAPQGGPSALTAQLGSSPQSQPQLNRPLPRKSSRPDLDYGDSVVSASSTPKRNIGSNNDSSFSNLADIPDEEKARILRRHLVSAQERKVSVASGMSGNGNTPVGIPSPGGISPSEREGDTGEGDLGGSSGVQSAVEDLDSKSFPIPYDALGGDVT